MRPSAVHARDAGLLLEFRDAYVDLVNSSRPERDFAVAHLAAAIPLPEWQRKRQRTALAAGGARHAYGRHGALLTAHGAGFAWSDLDPVQNWEVSLLDVEQLKPSTIIGAVDMARADAVREHREAAERERGVKGVVADFIRWPTELREAVGPSVAQQRAATAVGVLGQVLVGTVTTAIGGAATAGIVAGSVKLWQAVAS